MVELGEPAEGILISRPLEWRSCLLAWCDVAVALDACLRFSSSWFGRGR